MSKLTYKVSYYVLYAIFAATLVVLGLFYFGGEMAEPLVGETSNPVHTETLLYLMYILLGLTVVITVAAFIFQFAAALKDNPMAALKSLIGLVAMVVLFVIAWAAGSEEPLVIAGYEGTENVPFWLKLTDMFLYSLYALLAACVVAMVGSSVKRALSRN